PAHASHSPGAISPTAGAIRAVTAAMRGPRASVDRVLDALAHQQAEHEQDHEDRDRDEEQDLGDADERAADPAEAEHREHEPDDEEEEGPFEHDASPFAPRGRIRASTAGRGMRSASTLPARLEQEPGALLGLVGPVVE